MKKETTYPKNLMLILILVLIIQQPILSQLNEFDIRPYNSTTKIKKLVSFPDKAIIIIYSSITTLKFDSIIEIVENRSDPEKGVYKLIVEPTKQFIFIQSVGYKENKIETKKLKPNDFVYYAVEPKQEPINPNRGNFVLRTVPSGANFEIYGLHIKGTTPYQSKEFLTGTFEIHISKEKYESSEIILPIVKNETISKTVRLIPKFGYITIETDPQDAQLYINDVSQSYQSGTPLEVPVGSLKINIRKRYHDDFIKTIDVIPNDDPRESILIKTNLTQQKGRLVVSTNAHNAQVYLGGELLGNTPIDQNIDAGNYALEVRKDNYRIEQRNIEVLNNQTTSENITLYQNGIINIKGTTGARVYINGKYENIIPIYNKIMEQGEYKIRVVKEGYDTLETTLTVQAEERTIEYNLFETKGRFFRWTAFGDRRTSSILNNMALSVGYFQAPLTKDFVYSLKNENEDYTDKGVAFDITLFFVPISINGGICRGDVTLTENDTLKSFSYYANVGWTPFVLWEAIYPSIGLVFNSSSFEYVTDVESIPKISNTSFGIYYGLSMQFATGRYGWFIKFSYQDPFDNNVYSNFLFLNLGVYHSFGYVGEQIK